MQLQCLSSDSILLARFGQGTGASLRYPIRFVICNRGRMNSSLDLVNCGNDLSRLKEFFKTRNISKKAHKSSKKTNFLMEKLLTPIALTLPVSRSFSISAHDCLKVMSSVTVYAAFGSIGSSLPISSSRSVYV